MDILNLYACLGGNRLLWGDEHNITAVELDPELARMYRERFPNDTVIECDAHQYLLDHYKEFDFIWTSPPCPSHSRARFWYSSNYDTPTEAIYPDLKLYEEILFLEHYFKGKYVVENVNPYYEPLKPAQKRGRHLYWTNFKLPAILSERYDVAIERGKDELKNLCEFHNIDFSTYKGEQSKQKIARNLVDYEAGNTILNCAMGVMESNSINQIGMFQ